MTNKGRRKNMQIEIKINDSYTEPKVVILTAAMTEEVNSIMHKLSDNNSRHITGIKDGKITIIDPADLFNIYASNGKVSAVTDNGEYILRIRLYEAEEKLNSDQFVRISNSEIINLKKVKSFDLNFAGTIYVELMNGTTTYVSRRYVKKIKKILGM